MNMTDYTVLATIKIIPDDNKKSKLDIYTWRIIQRENKPEINDLFEILPEVFHSTIETFTVINLTGKPRNIFYLKPIGINKRDEEMRDFYIECKKQLKDNGWRDLHELVD